MSNTTLDATGPIPSRQAQVPRLLPVFVGGSIVRQPPILLDGPLVLGREGDTTFADARLSRRHAEVARADAGWVLRDLGSHNGTYRRGRRVDEARLVDGDWIRLGETVVVFRDGSLPPPCPIPGLVGRSAVMEAVRASIRRVAPHPAPILLHGESGSGKGQAARAIHELSGREGGLVKVNASTIPESLAESALFGHRQGAFTGASQDARGFFAAADRGTLFLDEVVDLTPAVQAKLLHAVEEGEVIPVGDTRPRTVDVRIVCATNTPLAPAIEQGDFRGDLYMRLAGVVLTLPPLRDRPEDVLDLLATFWNGELPRLRVSLVEHLLAHAWPYNVRELQQTVAELQIAATDGEALDERAIEHRIPRARTAIDEPAGPPDRERLVQLLRLHRGVLTEVAAATGRSRKQVYRWLDKHGLDADDYR